MSRKMETVEEFVARGGKITKCKTYGIRKFSSIPKFYESQNNGLTKKKQGIDAQELLDNALGTKDEQDVIAFLESQGYEVN